MGIDRDRMTDNRGRMRDNRGRMTINPDRIDIKRGRMTIGRRWIGACAGRGRVCIKGAAIFLDVRKRE